MIRWPDCLSATEGPPPAPPGPLYQSRVRDPEAGSGFWAFCACRAGWPTKEQAFHGSQFPAPALYLAFCWTPRGYQR